MKGVWIFVGLLVLSASARAQVNCDETRTRGTWKNTTLFALTYKCIPEGWEDFFGSTAVKTEVKRISNELRRQVRAGGDVNPAIGDVFRAMYDAPLSGVKAIIIGQDPAPTKGQATGLAFSLKRGTPPFRVPSVIRAILEARNEGFAMNVDDGDLSVWAERGVLMLNTALTIPCPVEPTASCKIGGHLLLWKPFSKQLIKAVDAHNSAQAYILWGSKAAALAPSIVNPLHRVFKGGHPSPVSDGRKFSAGATSPALTSGWTIIEYQRSTGAYRQDPRRNRHAYGRSSEHRHALLSAQWQRVTND